MLRFCVTVIFVISSAQILVESANLDFKDCGSSSVAVKFLDFDCEGGQPDLCIFVKGETYHGRIGFTTTKEIANGRIVLHAIIGSAELPFPFPGDDFCKDHNITCPIESGLNEVFSMALQVPSFAPITNLEVKFAVESTDTDMPEEMCVMFLGVIKESNDLLTV